MRTINPNQGDSILLVVLSVWLGYELEDWSIEV
jgi:hypothetical protein